MNIQIPNAINQREYQNRRKKIFNKMDNNSIAIIANNKAKIRSRDNHYPLQPNNDFYYLTGFDEINAVAILTKENNKNIYILFSEAKNLVKESWQGEIIGQQKAITEFMADESYPIDQLSVKFLQMLSNKECIYRQWQCNHRLEMLFKKTMYQLQQERMPKNFIANTVKNFDILIHELRLIKSPAEIEQLQYAIDVSILGHIKMMQKCQAGAFEYQLQAEFSYIMQNHNCLQYAYNPIVASGNNSCILHYDKSQKQLQDGELLLADVGACYNYYNADITRTYPVNGKFNNAQQAIYEAVLAAQLAGEKKLQIDISYQEYSDEVAKTITLNLKDLGLLQGNFDDLWQQKAYKKFYFHGAGHYLGLDVHDVGNYYDSGKSIKFKENMVMTNEPGIYIPYGSSNVAEKWWGIGIRLEDNIVITKDKVKVLSEKLPKTISEIELLCNNKN